MTADLMTLLLVEARLLGGRTTWLAGDEIRLAGGFGAAAVGSVTIGGARFDFFLEVDDGGSRLDLFRRKYLAYVRYAAAVELRQRKFQRQSFPVVLVVTRGP